MFSTTTSLKQVVMVRLNPGEDILLSLREAVKKNNIHSAIILNGFGSVSKYHFHVVDLAKLPTVDVYVKENKACDILAMSGLIIDGRVHAHITLSNKNNALGGHLEEGCLALTFSVIYMVETPSINYTDWDQARNLNVKNK